MDKVIFTVCGESKKYDNDKNNSDYLARASKYVISQQLVGCSERFCVFVCWCVYVTMASIKDLYAVDVTLFRSLRSFHSVYFTMLMPIY